VVVTPGGVASELTINGLPITPASGKVLYEPTEIAFDGVGNLYISDWQNNRIVEVSGLVVAGLTSSGNGTVIGTGSFVIGVNSVTGVAVDQKGTVYIADRSNDRVIQVTAAGVASLLAPNGLTFSNPQGVGVDGMGNIYVADAGNNRIVEITTAGVASVVSINGLTSPTILGAPFGVTVDPSGNLYIPDWNNNRIVYVSVSAASLTFASTNVGLTSSDSPKTATVTNLGNQPLVVADPIYTADFSQDAGDTNLCAMSTPVAAGMSCDVSAMFTPQSVGNLSASIVVTDNNLNVSNSTQNVGVSGTGVAPADTTAVAVSTNPTTVSLGQAVTVTVVVTDTAGGHTGTIPTGGVTFMDAVGGTVVSLNGGVAVALDGTGTASLTGVILSGVGTHTITASYVGVNNVFVASSNTTTVTVNVDDFSLNIAAGGSTSATVSPGGTATYSFTVAPSGGPTFLTAITLSVTGLPTGAVATITPQTLAVGTGSTDVTLSIQVPSQTAMLQHGDHDHGNLNHGNLNHGNLNHGNLLALKLSPFIMGMLFLPFGGTLRRATGKQGCTVRLLLILLVGISFVGITACGNGHSLTTKNYTLTMTATSGTQSHSTSLTLTVR
jgi:sugar lactone lactonase YvrE